MWFFLSLSFSWFPGLFQHRAALLWRLRQRFHNQVANRQGRGMHQPMLRQVHEGQRESEPAVPGAELGDDAEWKYEREVKKRKKMRREKISISTGRGEEKTRCHCIIWIWLTWLTGWCSNWRWLIWVSIVKNYHVELTISAIISHLPFPFLYSFRSDRIIPSPLHAWIPACPRCPRGTIDYGLNVDWIRTGLNGIYWMLSPS